MRKWYRANSLKFEKVGPDTYVCGEYEIVRVKGYHFAFHNGYLLNRDEFSKQAAYTTCLVHAWGRPLYTTRNVQPTVQGTEVAKE